MLAVAERLAATKSRDFEPRRELGLVESDDLEGEARGLVGMPRTVEPEGARARDEGRMGELEGKKELCDGEGGMVDEEGWRRGELGVGA